MGDEGGGFPEGSIGELDRHTYLLTCLLTYLLTYPEGSIGELNRHHRW